jgi:hypothetical protein
VSGGWIGVDLDGTLAHYDGWRGTAHIGEPVPAMRDRVLRWMAQGLEVRIFTARVCLERLPDSDGSGEDARGYIEAWLEKHGMGGLAITNQKDLAMHELWDDRAVQVQVNTGQANCPSPNGFDTP